MVAGCIGPIEPDADQKARDVSRLATAFPVLEELEIRGFRNQDWCRFLDDPRGQFTSNPESSTCNLFTGGPDPFDEKAQTDFDRVSAALRDTGVAVQMVWWLDYDDAGAISYAQFVIDHAANNSWTYVYDPDGEMPEDIEGEEVYTRIDANWYFWWEEWL
jgi:hypothetical protein